MSNLSDIGFDVLNIDDFRGLAEMVYYSGTGIRAGEGFYVKYHDKSGAELWLQIDPRKEVVGMNPHYSAVTRRAVQLTNTVFRAESPMDGAFKARFQYNTPGKESPQWQEFIFDMPDAHCVPSMRLPAQVELELCAFAVRMQCFDSLEAYESPENLFSTPLPGFLPADPEPGEKGLEGPDGDAQAMITGTIRACKTLSNEHSEKDFYWLRLTTLGGDIDVVADADVCSQAPAKGNIVSGRFWLSGRVHVPDDLKPRKGFLERLFWGAK